MTRASLIASVLWLSLIIGGILVLDWLFRKARAAQKQRQAEEAQRSGSGFLPGEMSDQRAAVSGNGGTTLDFI